MFALKEKEKEAWNFLNDVNKSSRLYAALNAYHALEEANKTVGIHGGIKWTVYNKVALDQYFIIVSENSKIIEKFYTFFHITNTD